MFVISFMDSVNASQYTIILIFKLSFVSFMFSIPLNSANICLYFYCLSFQRKYVSNCPYLYYFLFNQSDQISRSVVSDSLRPHESQHARPPCPSPTPGVHSDSRPSSQWCHSSHLILSLPLLLLPPIPPSISMFLFSWPYLFGMNTYSELGQPDCLYRKMEIDFHMCLNI